VRGSARSEAQPSGGQQDVSEARALYREAFQHFANDRLDEAVAAYRRSVEADPTLAIAWNGLAMAMARQGDFDGAIEAGRKLVELDPDDPLGHTSLSMFYMRKGMIPEAEHEKALALRLGMKTSA
jgi:Flp pilus assembly protein TadD